MMYSNLILDLMISISKHRQNLAKFYQFVLKILRDENLTSIKGHNSVTKLRKMTGSNLNQDLVNINVHTKFGPIL